MRKMAERMGFEPMNGGYPLHDFQSCSFNQTRTPLRGEGRLLLAFEAQTEYHEQAGMSNRREAASVARF